MKEQEREIDLSEVGELIAERLKNGQQIRLTVVGTSMYPLFCNKRDSAVLAPIGKEGVKKGSVVFYKRSNGQFVLHRIIKIDGTVYSANGDNHDWVESPLSADQFLAEMVGFYRNGVYHSVTERWYRFYSFCWMHAKPFRKPIMRIYQRIIRKKRNR